MSDTTPPKAAILNITGSILVARALAVAVEFELPDLIRAEPRSADDLAAATATHPGALYRILRMLASNGVFAEDDDGRFHPTPMSEILESGGEDSLRDLLRIGWQDITWDSYRQLPHTLRTGEPGFDAAFGESFFDYLANHQEANDLFDAAMSVFSETENDVIAAAYEFGQFNRVADVGGGQGGLLAAILSAHPEVSGVLFDQPQVIANPERLEAAGLTGRWEAIGGDFFASVPAGLDVYVLKRILHDWNDSDSIRILRACANALPENGRVLAIDAVMTPGNEPDPNKSMDVSIMTLTRGRERSDTEFRELFAAAGLQCVRIIPTERPSTLSIVEGVAAQ